MHRLTKAQARRIAVRAQLLDAPRPTDLLSVVRRLTLLQIDPTAAIAPSADLVAWSRLGSAYEPDHLRQALEEDRTLFERDALVRPIGDLGLHLAGAAAWPDYERTRVWLRENDRFRRDVLDLLGSSGPLTSRDIPDTSVVPWASTGWTNNRNVTQMLECLMMRAEVAIAGRVGRERLWDLPERVYPADVAVPSVEEVVPRPKLLRTLWPYPVSLKSGQRSEVNVGTRRYSSWVSRPSAAAPARTSMARSRSASAARSRSSRGSRDVSFIAVPSWWVRGAGSCAGLLGS